MRCFAKKSPFTWCWNFGNLRKYWKITPDGSGDAVSTIIDDIISYFVKYSESDIIDCK